MNNILHMILMGLMFLSITIGIHYYLWIRMVRDTGLSTPWREVATIVLVLLALSIPVSMFVARVVTFDVSRLVTFAPYTWMGVMMLLFFAFLSIDLVRGIMFSVQKLSASNLLPVDDSRRRVLGQVLAGTTVLAVAGAASAGVVQAARKAVVKKVVVSIKQFPGTLNGLKIVQISDLHIGITVGEKWLADLVDRVNVLNPDIIAITGDLTDGDPAMLADEIAPLGALKATYGSYFVTGNHEYYSNANGWIAVIQKLGVRVLRNEALPIGEKGDEFYLAGVDDYTAGNFIPGHGQDVAKAMAMVPNKDKAVVLLAHQPRAVIDAADFGVDLVLAGHTHGGQIWPFTYLVGLQQPYNKGLYTHTEKTRIYVNQGTFMWGPPMRLGTECEITELILNRG